MNYHEIETARTRIVWSPALPRLVWMLGLTMVSISPVWGQQDRQPSKVARGADASDPVSPTVIKRALTALPKARLWKKGDAQKPVNPRRHWGRQERVRKIPKAPAKLDSLLGFQKRLAAVRPRRAFQPILLSIAGQGFSGVNPPDTVGDVGMTYYIQAINGVSGTVYTVYNKSDGSVAAGPFRLNSFGGPAGRGDPIVLYDGLAKRWLLSEFALSGNVLSIYISRTADPITGGWFNYEFPTPNFPDYPKYGVWHGAYYVTTNEQDGPAVYALDRASMLAGTPATMQRFLTAQLTGFGFQALTPCDVDGAAPPAGSPHYLLRHRDDEVHNAGANDSSQDFLDLYEFRVDWANPLNSSLTGPVGIPVAEFDSDLCGLLSFNCFPQQGSSIRLDPLREVVMWRLQYRNFGTHETMVGSFVTDVSGSDHGGVRWFELRKAGAGSWVVHQEGTYAPDSHNRFMSSIAMDGSGNIAVAYSISSSSIFPGLRYAGRLASDPMGTLPYGEHTLIDGAAANGSNRYGDYAAMTVDPADDRTFWFTGQYSDAANWSTRIGKFRFADEETQMDLADEETQIGFGRMGFVWAHKATASSYTPTSTYSYNSSRGAITITRSSIGKYEVCFAGLGGNGTPGGHVQVTPYGSTTHTAKVHSWDSPGADFIVHVRCFDSSGALSDTRYTVLVKWPPPTVHSARTKSRGRLTSDPMGPTGDREGGEGAEDDPMSRDRPQLERKKSQKKQKASPRLRFSGKIVTSKPRTRT